jgi:DNA-directed RNA polymerase specialized sigma24 family protein
MRRHNQRLYRAARAILQDETEVENALQQAYLNAFAHLDQFEARTAFHLVDANRGQRSGCPTTVGASGR